MSTDRAAGPDRQLAGRYRLGRLLGSGGGGIVREGEDTLLCRRVAIKEVRLPPMASQAERDVLGERVLREARAAARLHHPGLVAVYDVLDAEDHPWIVMEYVDGPSLSEIIRNSGRLSPLRVARIGINLAYALEAAHRGGVVHRDVKPGNVLVTGDGRARLTDFGIAVTEGDATLTSTGMLVGSPAYIAPERARGAGAIPAGDVWGLGATLFTAVEGEPPYKGDGALATLAAVVEGRRRPFQHSGPLRGVLSELMDSDPARRPSLSATRRRLRGIAQALEAQEATAPEKGTRETGARKTGPRKTGPRRVETIDGPAQATARPQAHRVGDGRNPVLGRDPTAMDMNEVAAILDHSGPAAAGVATGPANDGARPQGDTPGPQGGTAGPQGGTAEPASGTAEPKSGTAGPESETAEPQGGTATPESGTAGPESGNAEPQGGTAEPESETTEPESGAAGPSGQRDSHRSRTAPFAVLAAALVAVVAVTLGLILTGGSGSSHPARATSTTKPTTAPSDPARAPTPTSTPTSTATTAASTAPSSAPSSAPSTTPSVGPSAASSVPPGATGATNPDLDRLGDLVPSSTTPAVAAAGYTSHRAPAGWSVALPAGWRIADRGTRTTAAAPSGYPDLLVDSQAKAGPSAIEAWHSLEPSVRSSSPGYRLLSIRPADSGDGTNAAVWEFTFSSGGQTIHVLDFGLIRNGHGYALRWRVPADQWSDALRQLRTIFASFRPGP